MKMTQQMLLVAGLAACVSMPVSAQILFDNGPLVTTPPGACLPVGGQASEVQVGNINAGNNQNSAFVFRIADDFVVPAGGGWNVASMTHYAYSTGAVAPSVTALTLRIWNGSPADATSTVVWGDTTTNRLAAGSNAMTNIYRYFNATCGTTRQVQTSTITVGTTLPAGTYWVDWDATTSAASIWAPPVTITGQRAKPGGNAIQFTGTAWQPITEGTPGTTPPLFPQDMAYVLNGTAVGGGGCYANCDASTNPPCLNVNDFVCFNNLYAAGNTSANCDLSTNPPVLNVNDFVCFNNSYAAGCANPCSLP
jgi:hypothetical protein